MKLEERVKSNYDMLDIVEGVAFWMNIGAGKQIVQQKKT